MNRPRRWRCGQCNGSGNPASPPNAVGVIVRETRVPIEHQRPVPAPHIDRAAVMTRMVIIEQRRPVEIHRRRRIRINRHRPAVIGPPVRIERDIIQKIHRPRTDPDCPRLVGQTMISLENDPFRTPVDIRDTVHPLRNDRAIIARGIQVEIRRSDILESRPLKSKFVVIPAEPIQKSESRTPANVCVSTTASLIARDPLLRLK